MNLLLLGLPGSGKGTFSEKLVSEKKMSHLSTGDLFRYNMVNDTPLGIEAKSYINSGKYVPDEVTINMVKEHLKKENLFDNLIYDGFPRTIIQAEELDKFLKENNSKLDKVLYIDIDKEIVIERLKNRIVCKECGAIYNKITNKPKKDGICNVDGGELFTRKDDLPENIKVRLDVYEEQTLPLLKYYKNRIIKVDISNHKIDEFVSVLYKELGL